MHKTTKGVLLLFTRTPVIGTVKTRLIPDLGAKMATDVHCQLVRQTLALLAADNLLDIQIWLKGDSDLFQQSFEFNATLHQQVHDDLGDNMAAGFIQALKHYDYAIAIGSDCPELNQADIQQTKQQLEQEADMVIGPAEDGGYYLLGLCQHHPQLFTNIDWGGEKVFEQTMTQANQLSLNHFQLNPHYDVDDINDYKRYKKSVGKE